MAKDKCIVCGKDTVYDFETHIDFRVGYIEGTGQLCTKCYSQGTDRRHITIPMNVVYNTPNDTELGEKVRQIYWESEK